MSLRWKGLSINIAPDVLAKTDSEMQHREEELVLSIANIRKRSERLQGEKRRLEKGDGAPRNVPEPKGQTSIPPADRSEQDFKRF